MRTFFKVFSIVFIAELGDKTQLATLLFAGQRQVNPWVVFAGSASALVLAAGLGTIAGGWIGKHVGPDKLRWIAGIGFVALGLWTLLKRD